MPTSEQKKYEKEALERLDRDDAAAQKAEKKEKDKKEPAVKTIYHCPGCSGVVETEGTCDSCKGVYPEPTASKRVF